MALTRNHLKAMGLTEEQISAVIEGHTDTVNALTRERDEARNAASKVEELTRERDDYKAKYEKAGDAAKVQADFDAYKKQIETEKANAAKSTAVRAALKAAGVNRDEFAELLLGKVDMDKVELDGDKIKDADGLIAPLKGSYAGCFGEVSDKGTPPANPPSGGGGKSMTKAEILAIEDTSARQEAIANNLELFQ